MNRILGMTPETFRPYLVATRSENGIEVDFRLSNTFDLSPEFAEMVETEREKLKNSLARIQSGRQNFLAKTKRSIRGMKERMETLLRRCSEETRDQIESCFWIFFGRFQQNTESRDWYYSTENNERIPFAEETLGFTPTNTMLNIISELLRWQGSICFNSAQYARCQAEAEAPTPDLTRKSEHITRKTIASQVEKTRTRIVRFLEMPPKRMYETRKKRPKPKISPRGRRTFDHEAALLQDMIPEEGITSHDAGSLVFLQERERKRLKRRMRK